MAESFDFDIALMIRANLNAFAGMQNIPNTGINIYPNPAKNELKIENLENESTVEIYNSLGQKIHSFESNQNNITLDISMLQNGFYTVKTISGLLVSSSKFVKN